MKIKKILAKIIKDQTFEILEINNELLIIYKNFIYELWLNLSKKSKLYGN